MNVLGIESSCDETGVALVQWQADGKGADLAPHWPVLRAAALHSQIEMHRAYGGVVPELASRDHIRRLPVLTRQVVAEAKIALRDIDCVAFTRGPGLAGALLTGAAMACALAASLGKPTLGVHHLEGHLLSPFLGDDPPRFPFVALLVSGGHTQLMRVDGVAEYALLGETIDDAAGEAFDKTAKLLGLPYPGGPQLARLAADGDARAFKFPRPMLHSADLDFSFAGLKTAVLTQVKRLVGDTPQGPWVGGRGVESLAPELRRDLAASVQAAITQVLVKKSLAALAQTGLNTLVVAGGVGANQSLRQQLHEASASSGIQVHFPPLQWCSDNGAMIALAAAMRLQAGKAQATRNYSFDIKPRWPLDQI